MFMKIIKRYGKRYHVSSLRRQNENSTECAICEITKIWYRIIPNKKVPKRLWDYGLIWIRETVNLSVSSLQYASGRTHLEYITGDTPDISK